MRIRLRDHRVPCTVVSESWDCERIGVAQPERVVGRAECLVQPLDLLGLPPGRLVLARNVEVAAEDRELAAGGGLPHKRRGARVVLPSDRCDTSARIAREPPGKVGVGVRLSVGVGHQYRRLIGQLHLGNQAALVRQPIRTDVVSVAQERRGFNRPFRSDEESRVLPQDRNSMVTCVGHDVGKSGRQLSDCDPLAGGVEYFLQAYDLRQVPAHDVSSNRADAATRVGPVDAGWGAQHVVSHDAHRRRALNMRFRPAVNYRERDRATHGRTIATLFDFESSLINCGQS